MRTHLSVALLAFVCCLASCGGSSSGSSSVVGGSPIDPRALDVESISVDPANPDALVLVHGKLIESTPDAGRTWIPVPGIAAYEVHHAGTSSNVVLAMVRRSGVPQGLPVVLARSVDGGRTFPFQQDLAFGREAFGNIAVDPLDERRFFVGLNFNTQTDDARVLRTNDGGLTLSETVLPIKPFNYHFVGFDPSKLPTVFAAASLHVQGAFGPIHVYKSVDGGATFAETAPIPSSVASQLSQLGGLAVTGSTLLVADDDGVMRSTDEGATWERRSVPGGIGYVVVDPQDPATIYGLRDFVTGPRAALVRSTNGGQTFEVVRDGRFTAFAAAPSDPRVLYLGGPDLLLRSDDRGATWRDVPRLGWTIPR